MPMDYADRIFAALADGTRRDILGRLSRKKCSISELAQHYQMTLPAVSKHIRTLEDAQLLHREKVGRSYVCSVIPDTFTIAIDQIESYRSFWSGQLDRLEGLLEVEGEKMKKSVEVTREFRTSPDLLFKGIASGLLFRDTGIINETLELHFEPGGTFSFEWVSGGRCFGTFAEIVENERVVFSWETVECDAPTEGATEVTIQLTGHGANTVLKLTHGGIPSGKSYENHLHGWTTSFDDFSGSLARIDQSRQYS